VLKIRLIVRILSKSASIFPSLRPRFDRNAERSGSRGRVALSAGTGYRFNQLDDIPWRADFEGGAVAPGLQEWWGNP